MVIALHDRVAGTPRTNVCRYHECAKAPMTVTMVATGANFLVPRRLDVKDVKT